MNDEHPPARDQRRERGPAQQCIHEVKRHVIIEREPDRMLCQPFANRREILLLERIGCINQVQPEDPLVGDVCILFGEDGIERQTLGV